MGSSCCHLVHKSRHYDNGSENMPGDKIVQGLRPFLEVELQFDKRGLHQSYQEISTKGETIRSRELLWG